MGMRWAIMQSVEAMSERILYWLSLDMQVRALAERLLQRFAVTVGDLPASAAHHPTHPGGLDRQSMEAPPLYGQSPRTDTLVSSKTFPKQNFFAARRSFLPTPWGLGYLRAEFAPLMQAPGGQLTTTGRNF